MAESYTLYGAPGSGAVAVEAALTLAGQPYRLIDKNIFEDPGLAEELAKVNPQRQLPALVLPSGELMTESAAILLHLTDAFAGLGPQAGSPLRPRLLRWMAYVAAQIYALYWMRDHPERVTRDKAAGAVFAARADARITDCWRMMDAQLKAEGRFLLGDEPGVLDIYVALVSRWRPGRRAFYAAAPGLAEVVRRLDADPRLEKLWAERYPFSRGWDVSDAEA